MTELLIDSKEEVSFSLSDLNDMLFQFLHIPRRLHGYCMLNVARIDMIQDNRVIRYRRTFGIDSTLQEFLDKITVKGDYGAGD